MNGGKAQGSHSEMNGMSMYDDVWRAFIKRCIARKDL